ncbi:very short patch repair endonuclease [Agrobacterium deltaense]
MEVCARNKFPLKSDAAFLTYRIMDTLTKAERSRRMSLIKGQNTSLELKVRRLVYNEGYRYRLFDKRLPGKPDLVFRGKKKVIFVHGCFWHQHACPNCKIAHLPKSNSGFWAEKLRKNRERDQRNLASLEEMGWEFLVLWECELKREENLLMRISAFLCGPKANNCSVEKR